MPINEQLLGQMLVEKKLVSDKLLKNILDSATKEGLPLHSFLFKRELISDEKLGVLVAELYKLPYVSLSDKTIPDPLLRIVPHALAAAQYLIPFEKDRDKIKVAINNPDNRELLSFLEKKTGFIIEPYYATLKEIKGALKAYNKDVNQKFTRLLKGALADPTQMESLKDASKILDTIILFAFQSGASDIHIEPRKDFFVVRYRVDGILQTITELPAAIHDLVTTRIKVLSNMRTDEHMAAQDGRFKIDLEQNEITMRVSIVPTYDGEKTVLRILSSSNQELNLESLGYSPQNLEVIHRNILKTSGIILMTGPTGSGKTTTLYSILKLLNSPKVNISTIEDPVEYRVEGINQIQVNNKTNLTFAMGLRALLRQDPDIVMVGEIRDEETAGIAINAALTGHVVLATLHTNDASSTLPRMLEMGVEAFLLSATIRMVVAQRLVRTICEKCRTSYAVTIEQISNFNTKLNFKKDFLKLFQDIAKTDPALAQALAANQVILHEGKGCATCDNTGFKGRTTIVEILEVSDNIKQLILKGGLAPQLEAQAAFEGMDTMFVNGMKKVLKGETSIEEILRVMRA